MPTDPTGATSDAASVIAKAREITGFLDGAEGGCLPGWYGASGDRGAVLRELHAALAAAYPEAGAPLWAVRLWTNLLWQPAYLMVVAAHFSGTVPALRGLSQRRKGADIVAYRYLGPINAVAELDERIARAGAELRAFADGALAEINEITRLKRIPALRLLTDRMLGIMVMLQRKRPELPADQIRHWCAQWLEAMDLTGHGDLEGIRGPDGREHLMIARKGCCLDYLVTPGSYCASCPKQPDDVRIARQRADALPVAVS